jgi:imidazolonepropionase-like amidohydrolase
MSEGITIHAGRLIDGTGTAPRQNVYIRVHDGAISDITQERPADGQEIVDASHLTVMPGLIDCHVHLCFDPVPDVADRVAQDSEGVTLLRGVRNAAKTLRSGVTTVRNVGTRADLDLDLHEGIKQGMIVGPRIVGAGRVICITGGHGYFMGFEADGPEQIRHAVRTLVKRGAQVIKLTITGGISTPGTKYGRPLMSREEIAAAVEEAHRLERKVCVHAQGWEAITDAVEVGVDSIEHGFFRGPDDPNLGLMVEKGIYLVPTLISYAMVTKYGVEGGIPAEAVAKAERSIEEHRASFAWAVDAGVVIAMGSDAGTEYNDHGTNPGELGYMVTYSSMSPMDAIVASTRNAAELLGIASGVGTVEPGKAADLIAMEEDPLEDVAAVERLSWVIKGGVYVRRDDTIHQ